MAKLTRRQTGDLEYVLRNLECAQSFLNQHDVSVARKSKLAITTLHYTRADGNTLYEIDKQIGSDLTGIGNAVGALRAFLS